MIPPAYSDSIVKYLSREKGEDSKIRDFLPPDKQYLKTTGGGAVPIMPLGLIDSNYAPL